jgi:hypothetical protein
VKWGRWDSEVTTYCVAFQGANPKRNENEWRAYWHREYGKPMLRSRFGTSDAIAESEVASAFHAAGWGATWQDNFHKAPGWMKPWTLGDVPRSLSRVLTQIRSTSPEGRPWDVLAWREAEFLFVECKAPGEEFTRAERAFIWGATKVGVAQDRFAVVCGTIDYPDRSADQGELRMSR